MFVFLRISFRGFIAVVCSIVLKFISNKTILNSAPFYRFYFLCSECCSVKKLAGYKINQNVNTSIV